MEPKIESDVSLYIVTDE